MSTTRSSRSSSSVTATRPATRSSSPTSKAKSSPSTPDPLPASATSATADAPEPAPGTRQCHRSPDTPTVTDVQMQNCHPCPETSHTESTLVSRVADALEHLAAAQHELVGLDPTVLSRDELLDLVEVLETNARRHTAVGCELIAELDGRGVAGE